MEGWKKDKLTNLISQITTGKLDANAMIPNGKYRFYTCAKDYYYIDNYAFDDEALLISGNGEYVGYIHYYKGKFNAYQRVYVLTGFKIDVRYLENFLNRYLPSRINKEVSQNNIPYIRLSTLSKMEINYPESPTEQASIANILSKVDEAIESVKKSIEAAEKLKKSLMQNLLTGRMKPDGTLRTEDEFYEDEKFGKVPIGWEVKKLGNLFHIKAGGDLQENFYSPIYDEQHKCPIFSNTIENSGLYGYTSNPRFISKESLTIVGRGVGVGHVEYRKGNYDAIIRLISLIPKQEDAIDCMYVNYYICQYVHFAIESTGVPQLTCPKVFSTKIIIPKNVFEQSQIAEKIHCIDIDIKIKQNQIITLERLKKSLMQNLLTGKVRVGEEEKYQNRRV